MIFVERPGVRVLAQRAASINASDAINPPVCRSSKAGSEFASDFIVSTHIEERRMRRILVIAAGAIMAAGVVLGADAKAGGAAFDKSCKGCHGATGTGNPALAKMFPGMPDLTSADVQGKSDADLVKVVKEGKGKMRPVANLSASPDDVVAFLRTLKH